DDLRTNPFQEEGNDANRSTTSRDPVQVPIGPITRTRAKKFKDELNGLIQEAVGSFERQLTASGLLVCNPKAASYHSKVACCPQFTGPPFLSSSSSLYIRESPAYTLASTKATPTSSSSASMSTTMRLVVVATLSSRPHGSRA
ncbi:hypothetical protein CRG98_031830, partial [Punica granatum]